MKKQTKDLPKDFFSWVMFFDWLNRHCPNQPKYKIEFSHPDGSTEIYEIEMSVVMQNAWLETNRHRPSMETQGKAADLLMDLGCISAGNPHYNNAKIDEDLLEELNKMYMFAEHLRVVNNQPSVNKWCSLLYFQVTKDDDYSEEFHRYADGIKLATENFKLLFN